MNELQTSHDEIVSQIDASNKPSKEEQKKEFQKAFSTLRNIEVMHGKDSQEYAGALTEYTNLKNKIIAEYNIILSQSEAAISSMKDPNSFENKPYAQMSIDEAKTALARLNSKYSGLEEASYTEKALGMLRSGFPSTEGEVTSKRLANIAQENLIKKIVGDTGYNNEFVVGFNNKEGNYLVKISEVEAMLKSESRSITSGNEASQINSRVVANYLKYLSNQAGGDIVKFQKLFIQKFGEKKAKELVELWNSGTSTNAKTELEGSGFGKIIENINNIDINNIGENFIVLGIMTDSHIRERSSQLGDAGLIAMIKIEQDANIKKETPGACRAAGKFLSLSGVPIIEQIQDFETNWNKGVSTLVEKYGIDKKYTESIQIALLENLETFKKSGTISTLEQQVSTSLKMIVGESEIKKIDIKEVVKMILKTNAIELRNQASFARMRLDRLEKDAQGTPQQKILLEQSDGAILEADEAAEQFTNYTEFKKVSDSISGILTRKMENLTPELTKMLLNLNGEELGKYLGSLGISALVEILPKLSQKNIRYDMIDQNLRDSSDCGRLIKAFPGKFTWQDIASFNSFAYFLDTRKNGNTILDIEVIDSILEKIPSPFYKKTLVRNIFDFASDDKKLPLIQTLISSGKVQLIDIPLDILKGDDTNILGVNLELKKTLLSFGDIPDIESEINAVLRTGNSIQEKGLFGKGGTGEKIAKINDYLEKYGIEKIPVDLLQKLVHKKGIKVFPPLVWKAKNDKDFALSMTKADATTILYINTKKWPDADFVSAVIIGMEKLDFSEKQNILDAYQFSKVQDIIKIYHSLGSKDKTLFLSNAVQKSISECLKNSKQENVSTEDIDELKQIAKVIETFNNQKKQVEAIGARYRSIEGKNRIVFEEKIGKVIISYHLEKDQNELMEIFRNPDWFEVKLADIIRIFGSDGKRFEDFIKEITGLEKDMYANNISEKEGLAPKEALPSNVYKEAYLTLLAKKRIELAGKSSKEISEITKAEFLKIYGTSPEIRIYLEKILPDILDFEKASFIHFQTAEAIKAQQEGKFDDVYSAYLSSTYNIPELHPKYIENAVQQNQMAGSKIVNYGKEYLFISHSGQSIDINKQEAALLANNPEAQANLIDAYNTLSSLGMEKFWEKRADIFRVIQANESSMMFNVQDGNYMSDTELGRFLRYILKAVDQESEFEWAKRDMSSMTTKQIVEFIKKEAYNNAMPIHDEYGDTPITKVFFQKFTKQNAGRASQRIQANEFGNSINT